jgi:hypothetical protein
MENPVAVATGRDRVKPSRVWLSYQSIPDFSNNFVEKMKSVDN